MRCVFVMLCYIYVYTNWSGSWCAAVFNWQFTQGFVHVKTPVRWRFRVQHSFFDRHQHSSWSNVAVVRTVRSDVRTGLLVAGRVSFALAVVAITAMAETVLKARHHWLKGRLACVFPSRFRSTRKVMDWVAAGVMLDKLITLGITGVYWTIRRNTRSGRV